MRVNEHTKNISSERYSEFYNALNGPIDKVLNSRPVHLDTLNAYVPVEKSEKALSRFFWQNDKSTALVKGVAKSCDGFGTFVGIDPS